MDKGRPKKRWASRRVLARRGSSAPDRRNSSRMAQIAPGKIGTLKRGDTGQVHTAQYGTGKPCLLHDRSGEPGLAQIRFGKIGPTQIGAGMATALITTFYGAVLANAFFLPLQGKLETRSKEEMLVKFMAIEGIMAIQRIIDQDNIPYDGDGRRLPLSIALEPNYDVAPQPVEVSVGAT